MRLPLAFVALLLASGCSSTTTSNGETPATDSGAAVDTGKADAAKADSTADSAPDGGGADAAGVTCGGTFCPSGKLCCAAGDVDAGFSFTCASSCPDGAAIIACDGPEDCKTGGPICCAEVLVEGLSPACSFKAGVANCRAACVSNIPLTCPTEATVRPCHKAADCPESAYPNCCEFESGGTSATFCADDTMKFVAVNCY